MRKKAVSPLIATVLLIAFAVALGAVVMSWGIDQFKGEEAGDCPKVKFSVEKIAGVPDICYISGETNTLKFLASNEGDPISKFSITLISTKENTINDEILTPLGTATEYIKYNYPSDFGTIQLAKIIPVLVDKETGEEKICSDNKFEVRIISQC